MPQSDPTLLVSTEWLAEHLNAPDVRIVDASWYLPSEGRNPRAEYEAEHIPEAIFFDLDDICDSVDGLPHMLPSAAKFASRMRKLGIGDGNRVVVYDGAGLFSAARAWWMFKTMGHEDVAVLDGGLPKWKAERRALSDMPPIPRERHYTARLNNLMVRDITQVLKNCDTGKEQIFDARSRGRYQGTEAEPRPELRKGHIPGSLCLPFTALLNDDKTMKSEAELREVFDAAGYNPDKPAITSCGSGVTAAVLYLGLSLIGHRAVALYDGSWAEWGSRQDTPIDV